MKVRSIISLAGILLTLSAVSLSQSKETGAIFGTVMDEGNNPLAGVKVTITGTISMGERKIITDARGSYRFLALHPGLYTIKAELPGFSTVFRENIRLHTTTKLTADITMKIAAAEKEVKVIAESPLVDVKSSEAASVTLADEVLRNMPTSLFVNDIANLAPGVDQDVAYGASQSTGISYQVDGLDVSDPEAGSAWVLTDYNIIEEAKIVGAGLNAEYGAFTGVILNTITKSGGNESSGHLQFFYQNTKKGFWTVENNKAYIEDFPELESPLRGMMDVSYHLGGPIQNDKLWYFTGAHWYQSKNRPAGFFPEDEEKFVVLNQPSALIKITSQPSSNLNLTVFFEYDNYLGKNIFLTTFDPPEICTATETLMKQTAPDYVGNFSLITMLGPKTFFNLKGAFFIGYYYLDPQGEDTAIFSAEQYQWLNNSSWWFKADRKRYQANAALSHYAEDFLGQHDFKFGAEFENGWVRNRFGYTGYVEGIGDAVYIYDWYGYLYAYQNEGYDTETSYIRTEFYAQDAWTIFKNFTLNFGARFSLMRGYVKDLPGALYKASRIAPRVGFAWDLFGNHSTVLKGHYGQYTEAMYSSFHDRLNPASHYSDIIAYSEWPPGSDYWYEDWRLQHKELYRLSDQLEDEDPYKRKIKHPYLEQYTVGLECELLKDTSLGISFIYRNWKDLIGVWDINGQYEEKIVNDPLTDVSYTVYNMTNPYEYSFVIGNLRKGDPWISDDPYRNYWAVEILINKRFFNRWQLLASYVYSRCTGTIDNGFAEDIGWSKRSDDPDPDLWIYAFDPNFWIYTRGNMTRDPTHMFKLQGTLVLPLDIWLNVYFRYITGNTYTRSIRVQFDQFRGSTIFTESRGSRRYPDRMTLDLRLEKTFRIADRYRLGFTMDIFNVFNDDTVTSWGTVAGFNWWPHEEYEPEASGPDGHVVYGLAPPRAIRLGIRIFF